MSYKVLIFCTLLLIIVSGAELYAQCERQPANVKHQISTSPSGAIEVTLQLPQDLNITRIGLYDLNTGRVVAEVKMKDFGKEEAVFKAVRPSIYMFFVWISECDKPLVYSGDKKSGVVVEIE